MNKDITGILLAGGKNSRMKKPKAFLEINGIRLIDHALSIYRKIFPELIIVTNDPLSYKDFTDSVIVTDIYKEKGPLGGIYAGLFYAVNHHAFVAACDMPFLNEKLISYMIELSGHQDIVVPQTSDGFQPLHAIYSRKCLPSIKRLLQADKLKITGFYKEMHPHIIAEEEIKKFDTDLKVFQNINTPEELEKCL
jgi:molybdopterin-guanine dinucleotide biosynthesis protein A